MSEDSSRTGTGARHVAAVIRRAIAQTEQAVLLATPTVMERFFDRSALLAKEAAHAARAERWQGVASLCLAATSVEAVTSAVSGPRLSLAAAILILPTVAASVAGMTKSGASKARRDQVRRQLTEVERASAAERSRRLQRHSL